MKNTGQSFSCSLNIIMDFSVLVSLYLLTLVAFPVRAEECNCDRIYLPLCGDDGKTYDNDCLFECACLQSKCNLKVAHQGTCYEERNKN